MNYAQHSVIGIGTAGIGWWLLDKVTDLRQPDATTLLIAAGLIIVGSVAVDIDHPKAFISYGLPARALKHILPPLLLLGTFVVGISIVAQQDPVAALVKLSGMGLVRWGLLGITLALSLMIVSRVVGTSLGHRGPLHSFVFALAITVSVIAAVIWATQDWQAWWIGASFGWGWHWHILGDALTPSGVPFWWPASRRRVRLFHPLDGLTGSTRKGGEQIG